MTACDQLDFQTSCQERGPGVLGGERAAATNAAAHAISRLTHGCQGRLPQRARKHKNLFRNLNSQLSLPFGILRLPLAPVNK